jgi:hypothetical protein
MPVDRTFGTVSEGRNALVVDAAKVHHVKHG